MAAAAAAAAYPPWVFFEQDCTREVQGSSSSTANTNTTARCRTTTGHPIDVALCLAAPPERSRVCVQLPDGVVASEAVVVAAHGDSVLLIVTGINSCDAFYGTAKTDYTGHYFVYSAGDAAAQPPRPPSLSLLPPDPAVEYRCHRDHYINGLLCRRDNGDLLVAYLKMERVKERDDGDVGEVHTEVALHLLRSGSGGWRVERPEIVSAEANAGKCVSPWGSSRDWMLRRVVSEWQSSMVIAVGDHTLCWLDVHQLGLLFCDDMFDESPSRRLLRYMPFPEEDNFGQWSVFATADGSKIKAVNVSHRCCCGGGGGKSKCRASHIHTWTMRLDDVGMAWVMDGSLDSNELWALDGYKGLPRVNLDCPVVSMDEPDAICFVLCERHHELNDGDETVWRIMVDMKNKTLRSVIRCPKPEGLISVTTSCLDRYLPSSISNYFNSKPRKGQPPGPAAPATRSRIKNKLQAIDDTTQAASPEVAILAALQEIPGLDRDDMLKAYRILTDDDTGRRFKSLVGLPMDLRKDWVLMEIKASESCVLCSACSADMEIKE